MTEVIMPKMGDGMEEGTLLEWLKKEGDTVKSGEVIGTIQTDKATLELEAPGSGTLAGLLIKGGDTVPVGQAIGAVLAAGESLPAGWGGKDTASATSQAASQPREPQPKDNLAAEPNSGGSKEGSQVADTGDVRADRPAEVTASSGAASLGRVKASPLAKKIAEEVGLDLSTISGSGPGGRIVEKDVRAAATSKPSAPGSAPVAAPAPPAFTPVAPTAADQTIPLPRLRQITAKRTSESKQTVPHFYVTVEVDIENILEIREMFEAQGGGKVSINDFVIKACALALREMPVVNSVYQGDKLLQVGGVHIGMAVALEDGLTVPVIKNADQLTLRQISAKSKELAGKAREYKLGLDELSGSTFSISNMGMLDVDEFIAIINQPNAAILAVASARKKVVALADDEIGIRTRMNITMSFDHRVVDGAVGARFINIVKSYLENPARLLS